MRFTTITTPISIFHVKLKILLLLCFSKKVLRQKSSVADDDADMESVSDKSAPVASPAGSVTSKASSKAEKAIC